MTTWKIAAVMAAACTSLPAPVTPSYRVDGLHLTGAPPLDASITHALAPYAAAASSRFLDISDDGQVALIASRGVISEVRAGHPGSAVRRIAGLDIAWARFASDGAIVATADLDGDETFALYRQARGGDPVRVGAGRHADTIMDRTRTRLAWASNTRDGVDDDIWVGGDHGTETMLHGPGGQWAPVDISGGAVLAKQTMSSWESALYLIDGQGVARITEGGNAPAGVIGPDGVIFAIADRGGDHLGLWAFGDGEPIALTPSLAWDVTALAISGDGTTLAYVTNQDTRSVLYLLDLATRKHRLAPGVPDDGVISDLHFANDARVIGFSFGNARQPRDAFRYDIARSELSRWLPAAESTSPPTIDPSSLVEPSRVTIASSGGVTIPALVYRPRSSRAPVIVQFHGGPEDQWLPRYAGFEQFLIARGYAIVQPNIRGSVGYGAAYAHLDDGPRRGDVLADVRAVLDWIATQPDLDARHVVAMGTSYGGYVALAALETFPDRLRGGIDVDGIADFGSFLAGTSPYRRAERRAEYGDERDAHTRDQLARLSPLSHAREIHRPLLVAHGARDVRVPISEPDRLVAALRARGQEVWYVRADDEGHVFTRASNRGVFQVIATQFLDHLRAAP